MASAESSAAEEAAMSIITDILEFLGLIETAPDDGSVAPRVLVKIVDAIALNLEQGNTLTLDQLAAKAGAAGTGAPVDTIRAILPDIVFARAFDSLSPEDIQTLVTAASAEDPTYVAFGFNNALEVVCDMGYDTSELEAALNNWTGVVEYAYTGADASDPNVVATGNPLFNLQKYLNAAPDGIGAKSAWAKGADGTGTNFIDLEQGWFLAGIGPPGKVLSGHVDLPSGITLLAGTNRAPQKGEHFPLTSLGHGASVLGMVVGLDDNFGIVGGAPKTTTRVISYFDPKDKSKGNPVKRVEAAIGAAAKALSLGDVLQLEVQFSGKIGKIRTLLPVEFEPFVFQAIRTATGRGIIVVEAAGNGGEYPNTVTKKTEIRGTDLDTFVDKAGKKVLSRSTPADFQNSGAIMVAGSTSKAPHSPHKKSNFGSRIDCYGWGDDIVTCFWDPQLPNARDLYMGIGLYALTPFGGTSGACPMITASCLLMQNLQTLLTPKGRPAGTIKSVDMRTILSKPANGTASAAATDKIGVMPDFAKILANEFMP
jgi:hypothetical protein